MQDIIASFTTIMTCLVLLLCLVVVVLLGLAAWSLPSNRRRALLGVVLMALVVLATGVGWLLLSRKAQSWTRVLLPLAAPLLLVPGAPPPGDGWRTPGDRWVGAP